MALNIRNPEADALAHEISSLTGESLTAVVIDALRRRRDELTRRRSAESQKKFERIMEISRRAAACFPKEGVDIDEMLYDERGLPRSSSSIHPR